MKIIVMKAAIDSLQTFAGLMAENFQRAGHEVLLADSQQRKKASQEITDFTEPGEAAALFFNQAGLDIFSEDGQLIWNKLDVDCYNLIVDHPVYYHDAIIFPIRRLTFLCVDRYHKEFIERFYPGRVRSIFLPLAGIKADMSVIPFERRSMDVLFTGAYLVDGNVDLHIQGLGDHLKSIWLMCYEMLKSQTHLTLEQAVEYSLQKKGIALSEEDLRDVIRLFQDMDGVIRSHIRANVVKTLADHDIQVHLYGEGWEYLDCKQENLVIHSRVPFNETIPLMADAKIVLNVMPWFKAGAHDRVFTAMLNQSVILTDSSEFLDNILVDGKNALLFSLEDLDSLPEKLKHYLSFPEKLKEISLQGYSDVKDTQTWQQRADQLASIINDGLKVLRRQ